MSELVEKVFKKLNLETEEEREKFYYEFSDQEDEINVDGLGLSTYSQHLPNLTEIQNEIQIQASKGSPIDIVRRNYLKKLSEITGRNVILYYSGWLQKPIKRLGPLFALNDNDKNGFMATVHGLDVSKGLDLMLHTPGGDIGATESVIDYLRQKFGKDIRVIVPQLAMSGGTMIACASKEILMGRQSSLGPIDPQLNGIPASGILDEFQKAHDEIAKDKNNIPVWQPIIAKYSPALVGECQKAVDWSKELVEEYLKTGMFFEDPKADEKIAVIVDVLTRHDLTKSHTRHIPTYSCVEMGLKILQIEDNQDLQDAILSVHHASALTITNSSAIKIIENQNGSSFIPTYNPQLPPKPQ